MNIPGTEEWNFTDVKFLPIFKEYAKRINLVETINTMTVANCSVPGDIGRLLRREGLYSSNITDWRRAREKDILNAMTPQKRGRKRKESNPMALEVAKLQKENLKLEHKLKQAELIIEAPKIISQILGIQQNINDIEKSD